MDNRGRERLRSGASWRAALLFLAAFALAACGAEDEEGGKRSGLPGELRLTSLSAEQRDEFCEWFEAALPSEDACPSQTAEGEEAPSCLTNFENFGACTVEEVERCIASASTSSCELPDTEACRAFRACQEQVPPANLCSDGGFTCMKFTGLVTSWKGKSYTWERCWNWWPPGCVRCEGAAPTRGWAEAWCEREHPTECKNKACFPQGGPYSGDY